MAATETTFNAPDKVRVGGKTYKIREVPYSVFKVNLKQIYDLVKTVHEANPDVIWSEITAEMGTEVFFRSFSTILDGIAESLEGLVKESAEISDEKLAALAASEYVELVSHVAVRHVPVIRAFFDARDRLKVAWAAVAPQNGDEPPEEPNENLTGTGTLESSTDSSGEGSAMTQSPDSPSPS